MNGINFAYQINIEEPNSKQVIMLQRDSMEMTGCLSHDRAVRKIWMHRNS